jgi:hypothetical protein
MISIAGGKTLWRAAPNIGLRNNFTWFALSQEEAEPYAKTTTTIREYNTLKPLKLIDLNNIVTVKKLRHILNKSFVINNNKVKRITKPNGINQLKENIETAKSLQTYLLQSHQNINGWYHSRMERPGGGHQLAEILVFKPHSKIRGKAAQPPTSANPSAKPSAKPSPKRTETPPRVPPRASHQASPRASPRANGKRKFRQIN